MNIISFDADGTLIDLDFVNAFWDREVPRLYSKRHGMDFEKACRYVRSCYDALGDEDLRWYQPDYWFKRFDLEEDPEYVIDRIKHKVKVFPDAKDVLENLYGNYDLVVVSNAPWRFLNLGLKEIKHYFSAIYSCTSDLGMVRKKPEVYLHICERLGTRPEHLVHVGDHYKFDYEVPRKVGIRAYHVDRINKDTNGSLKDLRELLEQL
ncbi:MAG: HAD family hydrolase [Halobacteriota archaeon]